MGVGMEQNFFSNALIGWYKENRRELPWRQTRDPYLIWISEVILQQTRVVQGLSYFQRFTTRFPDIHSLAEASEDEVMKYWQGLGYYSRARNLHAAARELRQKFGGVFPKDYKQVVALKGIGEYTAAAIVSFAWKQPYAVVDGNVYRVLARVFGIDLPIDSTAGKKYFRELAGTLLDKEQPDVYNQAIMDFGALQCVPKSPSCLFCPLRDRCRAFAKGQIDRLPVKAGKTVVKPRYFNYLHVLYEGNTFLFRRETKDIWQNLYEFPLIETSVPVDWKALTETEAFRNLFGKCGPLKVNRMRGPVKHVLSHRIIYANFYEIEIASVSGELEKYLKVPEESLDRYAVSRLIALYLEQRASNSDPEKICI